MPPPTKALTPPQAADLATTLRRLRAGKSQELLAEGRSFSSQWLSMLERGKIPNVAIGKLAELSLALGLPSDALLRNIDGEPLPERAPVDDLTLLRNEVSSLVEDIADLKRVVSELASERPG